MASRGYFSNIPSIEYGSKVARNLITRPRVKEFVLRNPNVIYDYVIKDGERPDTIANDYYGNPNYAWLVMLANDIVDPYYDWPLDQRAFNTFIIDKYGTLAAAQSKILHYKRNYTALEIQGNPALKGKQFLITKETYDLASADSNFWPEGTNAGNYVAVYAYNDEEEKNEAKRTIKLIDARLATDAFSKLREAMIENV